MATAIIPEASEGQPLLPELINIDGWSRFGYFNDASATCVNPDASPGQLVSWAYGQVQQIGFLLNTMMAADYDKVEVSPPEVLGAFFHFLGPVENVLSTACALLYEEKMKAEGGEA